MKRFFTSVILAMLFCFSATAQDMIITGVFDGPLSGGTPKAVEFYVINNISDLSTYGFGSANNGGGSDGEEYTFPAQAATAGSYLYISTNSTDFNTYFGFNPDFTDGSAGINGDDAVELFHNGVAVDVFGDINVDGSGTAWDYLDGWAYRNDMGTASTTFTVSDWTYSGINVNDGETSNATAAMPFPIGTYQHSSGGGSSTTVTLNPSKDNTLYESTTGALSNGAGTNLFVGRTSQVSNYLRRGVIAFDLSSIPANATITSAKLTLQESRGLNGPQNISLHTLTTDWGEGTSVASGQQGSGTTATTGDATWIHTFSNTGTWTTPGGDYTATASATTSVNTIGSYDWTGLAADVQNWVSNPTTNFGWILLGNETTSNAAKRFNTKEDSSNPPILEVTYTAPVVVAPEVAFVGTATSVDENAGTVNINLSIANPDANATSIDVSVDMASTATSGMDYTFTSPTTVTFPANSSMNQTVSIPIIDDMMTEGAETIVLTLSNVTNNATIGNNGTYTITINPSDALTPAVVINEIYYNVPSTDSLEFLELYNNDSNPVDLTGWSFTEGFTYTFGNVTMQPGDYLVLCNDSIAFQNAFGIAAYEWTSGSLSNGGEDIELTDANNAVVDYVDYDDSYPWTEMADGAGNSLALCDVNADNSLASNWLPEINDAGIVINFSTLFVSPGAANAASCPTNPYFDIEWLTTEDSIGLADSIGTMAQIQGFVYGVNLRGSGLDFTVIDRYGGGISIFDFGPVSNYTVTEGDYVVINGSIGQFRGLTQLSPDSIMLVSGGHPLRLPNIVDSLGEFTESQLITIENVTLADPTQWSNSGSGFNVDITNGTDTFTMRIDNDVDLYSMGAPAGTFNVTGIGRQFTSSSSVYDDGYQIFPRYMADIDPYNTVAPPEPSYPAYDIATVTTNMADGVADSLGVQCSLTGIVHGVDMQGNTNLGFTIIDATGGIGVFSSNDFGGYVVTEGDELTLKGTISQFNGLTQINPDSLIIVSTGNALVTAPTVTVLDESTESELVTITNLTLVDPASWDASGGSFNADFTDGTNTYSIRIDSDVNIAGTTPFDLANDVVEITGIGGQFDSSNPFDEGYQLFPRYASDIQILINTDNQLEEAIRMYPNPMNDVFVIETTENIETVRITNALGQVVKTLNNVNGFTQVNVADLAQGMYFVTFTSESNSFTQQIVKQ